MNVTVCLCCLYFKSIMVIFVCGTVKQELALDVFNINLYLMICFCYLFFAGDNLIPVVGVRAYIAPDVINIWLNLLIQFYYF